MQIYKLMANVEKYPVLVPRFELPREVDLIGQFCGKPVENWPPMEVQVIWDEDQIRTTDLPDFIYFMSGIPALSDRAIATLANSIHDNSQVFPLVCAERKYSAINVVKLCDVLDEEKSEVKRFRSSGRIMRVLKYSFLSTVGPLPDIFKIPQFPTAQVFVTQNFVDRVYEFNLTGFEFVELGEIETK